MAKAKRIRGLRSDMPATAGIRLVLISRLGEMQGWRDAALDWTDPEGVHSMRVASRRLRSILRDFTPYLRKRALSGVLKELKDIADALGEVRDQDVAIMALEKIVNHAPAELSPALQQFIGAKREIRDRAREELKATLEQTE